MQPEQHPHRRLDLVLGGSCYLQLSHNQPLCINLGADGIAFITFPCGGGNPAPAPTSDNAWGRGSDVSGGGGGRQGAPSIGIAGTTITYGWSWSERGLHHVSALGAQLATKANSPHNKDDCFPTTHLLLDPFHNAGCRISVPTRNGAHGCDGGCQCF
jgi:hypothetical protein